jgi:hypothetical protein
LDVDGFALLAEVGPRDDQAREYLTYLLSAFTRYAHVEEGISPTKTEMARDELYRYFVSRSAGDLGPYSSRGRRGKRRAKKHRKKPTTGQHPLCPDPKTLDRFLGEMFGFMSVRHYQASAMFELIPVWLRFLEKYDLVDEEIQKGTLKELSYLGNHLVQYLEANDFDPLPRQNLEEWPAPVTHMQTS